ncbi:hypothetical protein LJC68_00125 [Bacteroidales bacterium OttesenSCG-928-B11]|nr:hypothetical protein [Bacteroidales bacterium OttesenSCG-928-E04]MDL2308406.1 hypothetical protein [Bacteroidales bacterium OttesenSCG-928-C03]MDL2311270.1 hypothetical protein [Bacteroidales bacterium OttesenSCG-928-B11]
MEKQRNFSEKNVDELLHKAIEIWARNEHIDIEDNFSDFYEIDKDPVVKLLMTAMAHQSNILQDDIQKIRENFLDDFLDQFLPIEMIKPFPAFGMLQVERNNQWDDECWADEETAFVIENKKGKGNDMRIERYNFVPLLKTKVEAVSVKNVTQTDEDHWQVELEIPSSLQNLSGLSVYFPNHDINSLEIKYKDHSFPINGSDDYYKLPFTSWFQYDHRFSGKALLYGGYEFWNDILASKNLSLFYIDQYEQEDYPRLNSSGSLNLIFKISSDSDPHLSVRDILFNCVPVVNVEKATCNLSQEHPIEKIAVETKFEKDRHPDLNVHKQFLGLLTSNDEKHNPGDYILRRFGTERYNKNEFLLQLHSILNRYITDYYAFYEIDELSDGEIMSRLNFVLKDFMEIAVKTEKPQYGYYLLLKALPQQKKRISVDYLVTDGKDANAISNPESISVPLRFDKKGARLIQPTFGGKDEEINKEVKKSLAQSHLLSKDRIYSKADIKYFCLRELQSRFFIKEKYIKDIDIELDKKAKPGTLIVRIQIDHEFDEREANNIEKSLARMINLRSISFCEIKIYINREA